MQRIVQSATIELPCVQKQSQTPYCSPPGHILSLDAESVEDHIYEQLDIQLQVIGREA